MKADFKHILLRGLQPEPMAEAVWKEDMELFDKARINSATVNVFSGQSSSRQKNGMILRNWTRSLKCWEKTIKTLSLQLQPRQCGWMFGNIGGGRTDYAGRHHKFGQRQNACQISLFTRDTRQNWLKSCKKVWTFWTVWCAGT